jgi:hypothetical protein
MFTGLTQIEATRIVMMATSEALPTTPVSAQQHADSTIPAAPDIPQPAFREGNNDVATKRKETWNKDEEADKKRKATENLTAARPLTKRNPSSEPDPPSGPPDPEAPMRNGPPARDAIEGWLDDETAAGRGFIRTERKIYRPPSKASTRNRNWTMTCWKAMTGCTRSTGRPSFKLQVPFPPETISSSSRINQNTPKNSRRILY